MRFSTFASWSRYVRFCRGRSCLSSRVSSFGGGSTFSRGEEMRGRWWGGGGCGSLGPWCSWRGCGIGVASMTGSSFAADLGSRSYYASSPVLLSTQTPSSQKILPPAVSQHSATLLIEPFPLFF